MGHLSMSPIFLLILVVVVTLMVGVASGQSDCQGKVGGYAYDLTPLARRIGAVDLQATDSRGWTYYYRVCGVVSNKLCQSGDDVTPAVCQTDYRVPAHWYGDCGNQKTATFSSLPSGNDNAGFTLTYTGGLDGRAAHIYFKCDPSKDPGVFSFIAENPPLTYNFQFVSKYACPTIVASPSPAPPSRDNACCLYRLDSDPNIMRTLCASKCPVFFGGFALVYNWTLSPCTSDTCFFHKRK